MVCTHNDPTPVRTPPLRIRPPFVSSFEPTMRSPPKTAPRRHRRAGVVYRPNSLDKHLLHLLNHNGQYVAVKHVVGHRATHDGFWRPEVDDGVAVFHRKETTKATLKHLAFQRPSGITAPKQTTSSIDAVTVRSGTSPTNRRSTLSNTGTRRSTSTAGRPCGTPS